MKFIGLVLIFAVCGRADENSTSTGREKRAMLFFDEDGNLMKSFMTPYMRQLAEYAARQPEHENFLKYFFNFLRPLIINTSTAAFMVPVSQDVVQQILRDPQYQHQLMISPRGPDYNPLCSGRRTQIASSKTCRGFLSCWDGWAYEMECPEGLMFSNEGYCDYADKVQCKDRATFLPEPQNPYCKQDFETFRNEMNCNEFFVCVNRNPVKFKCPADLAYNQKFGVCDYPNLVDCSSSSSVLQPSTAAPAPPSSTTSAPIPAEPSTTKPIFAQRPVPPQLINLPSTFPSTISQQINKIPESSFFDNKFSQQINKNPESSFFDNNISQQINKNPESSFFDNKISQQINKNPESSFFDKKISQQINKNPESSLFDNKLNQQNILPGINNENTEEYKAPDFQFKPKVTDGNAIFMQNSVYNSQNLSTPVAIMSPQDAIRFLKFSSIFEKTPQQQN